MSLLCRYVVLITLETRRYVAGVTQALPGLCVKRSIGSKPSNSSESWFWRCRPVSDHNPRQYYDKTCDLYPHNVDHVQRPAALLKFHCVATDPAWETVACRI